jgi:hypothetical protein
MIRRLRLGSFLSFLREMTTIKSLGEGAPVLVFALPGA